MQQQLAARFGGLTAFTRAPADGLWEPERHELQRDKIIIFEVLAATLDKSWWKGYRAQLEREFAQESIQILAQAAEKL